MLLSTHYDYISKLLALNINKPSLLVLPSSLSDEVGDAHLTLLAVGPLCPKDAYCVPRSSSLSDEPEENTHKYIMCECLLVECFILHYFLK